MGAEGDIFAQSLLEGMRAETPLHLLAELKRLFPLREPEVKK